MRKKDIHIQGVWCRQDSTFYYLDTGVHSIVNTQTRIINRLIAQGLIEFNPAGTHRFEEPYKLLTLAEAKELKHKVEVLYLNKHVEEVAKQKAPGLNGWD